MSNNLKYTLQKHKQKIILGATILVSILIIFGVIYFITHHKNKSNNNEDVITDVKADYIITGDEKGNLQLLGTKNDSILDTGTLETKSKVIYAKDNNLEKMMAYTDNAFYSIEETDGENLIHDIILKCEQASGINSFKFSDKYIVGLKENEAIAINLENKKAFSLNIKDVTSYVVYDNKLIYSTGTTINLYNLDSNELEKSEDLGDSVTALFVMNDKIIAFDKFGTNSQKYSIFELKPNLYIDVAYQHGNEKVSPVVPDSDDKTIPYVDRTMKNDILVGSEYNLDIESAKKTNKRTSLIIPEQTNEDKEYFNQDNTFSTKGYMYYDVNGTLIVYGLHSESVENTFRVGKLTFMPILK